MKLRTLKFRNTLLFLHGWTQDRGGPKKYLSQRKCASNQKQQFCQDNRGRIDFCVHSSFKLKKFNY